MLDWIAEKILAIVSFIPALFVDPNSPSFMLIRAVFGLLLLVVIIYLVVMRPLRSIITTYKSKSSKLD